MNDWLSKINKWRKSKGMTLALLVVILGIFQPYVESLNNPNWTLIIGLAIGVVRFYTNQPLSEK